MTHGDLTIPSQYSPAFIMFPLGKQYPILAIGSSWPVTSCLCYLNSFASCEFFADAELGSEQKNGGNYDPKAPGDSGKEALKISGETNSFAMQNLEM
jgi:hypothetical protein